MGTYPVKDKNPCKIAHPGFPNEINDLRQKATCLKTTLSGLTKTIVPVVFLTSF
jgi:hypothetical protein